MLLSLLCVAAVGSASAATVCIDDPDPDGATTKFDVRRHGCNFVNYFEGDVTIDLPLIGRVDLGDTSYGLCGGMTFAANDTFCAGGTTPDFVTPNHSNGPAEVQSGTPMRQYIYGRQIDSFRADDAFMIRRLISWSWRPIEDVTLAEDVPVVGDVRLVKGLYTLSDRQFRKCIAPELDRGNPVTLCIINADWDDYLPNGEALAPEGFTKNHQVLAIGYRFVKATDSLGKHWAIDVYDPNYPDEVHTLHYDQKGQVQTRRVKSNGHLVSDPDDPAKNRVGKFRGFFATPYQAKLPYWVDSTPENLSRLSKLLGTQAAHVPDEADDGFTVKTWRAHRESVARGKTGAANPGGVAAGTGTTAGGGASPAGSGTSSGGGSRPPKRTGSGGGLGNTPVPDVKASEGDTATALRGKTDHDTYTLVDCPEPRVRLGRIVAEFPGAGETDADEPKAAKGGKSGVPGKLDLPAKPAKKDKAVAATKTGKDGPKIESPVEVCDLDGKVLTWGNGDYTVDLLPGTYAVVVNKKRVEVPVEAQRDTVLKLGGLHVEAGKSTMVEVLDRDETTVLTWTNGPLLVGLFPGKYFVRMAKQNAPVEVVAGVVTEF